MKKLIIIPKKKIIIMKILKKLLDPESDEYWLELRKRLGII